MIYYIILFILSIIMYLTIRKKQYLFVELLLFSSLFCLRSPLMGVGSDTLRYVEKYIQISNYSFGELFSNVSVTDGVGFNLIMKIFSFFGFSEQFFVAFCFAFFLCVVFLFIKRYSKNYLISVLTLFACFIFPSCSYIRQFFALSICLIAFLLMDEKKYIKSVFFYLFALSVHFSSLIFIIVFILSNRYISNNKRFHNLRWLLFLVGSFFLIPMIKGVVLDFISIISPKYYRYLMYGIYGTDLEVSLIWPLILLTPLFINILDDILRNKHKLLLKKITFKNDNLFSMVLNIGVLVFSLASVVTEFHRVSQYLTIFFIIVIPNTIEKISDITTKRIIKVVFIFLIFVYMMMSTIQNYDFSTFKFYWQ